MARLLIGSRKLLVLVCFTLEFVLDYVNRSFLHNPELGVGINVE